MGEELLIIYLLCMFMSATCTGSSVKLNDKNRKEWRKSWRWII